MEEHHQQQAVADVTLCVTDGAVLREGGNFAWLLSVIEWQ
jgi:hypothetical protein